MKTLNVQNNNEAEKVDLLLKEASEIRNTNSARSLQLSKDAIKLAEEINYRKGLAKANFNAGISCRLASSFETALVYYKTAIKIYKQIDDKKGQSRVQNSIANLHLSLGEFSEAIDCFDECLYLVRSIGDIEFEGTVLANKALTYQQQGNLIDSLENNLQALSIYKSIDIPIPHTLLNNIGIIYLEIGNYYVALKYFNTALKIEEETKSALDESFTLANIGRTYIYMDDSTNAVTYLSEALIFLRKFGNRQAESQIFSNLGKAYVKLRCFPEAIFYMNRALKYYREISDKSSVAHTLAELGELYFLLNDFATSKKFFKEGLNAAIEINDELNIVRNNIGLASLYVKFMDLESAETYMHKAAQLAEKRNSYKELSKIYKVLSDGYMSIDNAAKSNEYMEKHYDYLKKLIQLEEENSLRAFTASHKFINPDKFRYDQSQKSEFYENYLNYSSSEILKKAANS